VRSGLRLTKRDEIERKYDSAARALVKIRSILSGNQNKDRDDSVTGFLSSVYAVLGYTSVVCGRFDKANRGTAARDWFRKESERQLLVVFRKIRDVDQHLFSARILHHATLTATGAGAISAPITWEKVRRNGLRFGKTINDLFWDRRMSWLRQIFASRPYRASPHAGLAGYSWGISAVGHNNLASGQHQLTPAEVLLVDSKTAPELFALILAETRVVIDDAITRGFL
jgi:hypothetical protein